MRSRVVASVLAVIAVLVASTAAAGAEPPSGTGREPVIVVFKDAVHHPAAEAKDLTSPFGARPTFTYLHAIKGFAATLPAAAIKALRANPKVSFVEADGPAELADTTQTPATWGSTGSTSAPSP